MDGRYSSSELDLVKSIKISETQRQALQNHAQKYNPNESCAILYGKIDQDFAVVEDIFLTENIDDSPVNFTISNEQLIAAYKKAEECNTQVIGIFHSHPSSIAYPSNTDRKFMHINPVVWVIYSGISKEFKAFILDIDVIEIQIEFL